MGGLPTHQHMAIIADAAFICEDGEVLYGRSWWIKFSHKEYSTVSDEKSQLERFKEAAKDVGADTSDDALDKIMDKLDLKKKPEADDKKDD